MKILIAAGGTGGHIYPGITVAETLRRRNPEVDVLFVGGAGGLEQELVGKAGFPFAPVEARPLPRRVSLDALKTGWTALRGLGQSVAVVRRFQPDAALGTGGYVSGPVMAAARLSGVPTVIQEQNAFPGLTSRLLGRFVDAVALGSEGAVPYFRRARRVEVTGNPIRRDIVSRSRPDGCRTFGFDPRLPTVLVVGGSQGGASLNKAMAEAAPALAKEGVQVLWQTGRAGFRDAVASLSSHPENRSEAESGDGQRPVRIGRVRILPFIDDMAAAYGAADVAVCRAGAMTLAELTARGLPAVLVPYPFAAEDHQLANAKALAAAGAAEIILDHELTGAKLRAVLFPLLKDGAARARMAAASRSLGRPDAAERVAAMVEALAAGRKGFR